MKNYYFIIIRTRHHNQDVLEFVAVSGDPVSDIEDSRVAFMDENSAEELCQRLRAINLDAMLSIYRPNWRKAIGYEHH